MGGRRKKLVNQIEPITFVEPIKGLAQCNLYAS